MTKEEAEKAIQDITGPLEPAKLVALMDMLRESYEEGYEGGYDDAAMNGASDD